MARTKIVWIILASWFAAAALLTVVTSWVRNKWPPKDDY